MGRGNGNLPFNLALILIFCHLSKQPACCRSGGEGVEGGGWPGFLRPGRSRPRGRGGAGRVWGEELPLVGVTAGSRQGAGGGGSLPKSYPGGTAFFVLPEHLVQT